MIEEDDEGILELDPGTATVDSELVDDGELKLVVAWCT